MTDPTPTSDRELESLRAQHVPVEFATLTGLRCRWSGHAWPCRTARLLSRLDEAEADREHWRWATERHMARASQMAQGAKRIEADRDRWKARAEEAEAEADDFHTMLVEGGE